MPWFLPGGDLLVGCIDPAGRPLVCWCQVLTGHPTWLYERRSSQTVDILRPCPSPAIKSRTAFSLVSKGRLAAMFFLCQVNYLYGTSVTGITVSDGYQKPISWGLRQGGNIISPISCFPANTPCRGHFCRRVFKWGLAEPSAHAAVWKQRVVTAYLKSKQLRLFLFAW